MWFNVGALRKGSLIGPLTVSLCPPPPDVFEEFSRLLIPLQRGGRGSGCQVIAEQEMLFLRRSRSAELELNQMTSGSSFRLEAGQFAAFGIKEAIPRFAEL